MFYVFTPSIIPTEIVIPSFIIVDILIATRFSGVTLTQLRTSLAAGLVTTFATVVIACLAAAPVAHLLGMPPAHVIVAFSLGGLESMVAMGTVLGANAGFVAACHVGRLFLLTLLVPVISGRIKQ